MRRPLWLPFSFFLKMYTKIIERHPLQIGRGILARATSVAALALAPKTWSIFKKNHVKNVSIYRAKNRQKH